LRYGIEYAILEDMKLTIAVKLQPTQEQSSLLVETLERANAACNCISDLAWETKIFGQYALHKAAYATARAAFNLSAQVVVRCIAKVADAYKLDKKRTRTFRPHGAIAYDDRILRWYEGGVSIWTTGGRQRIPFVCGARERALLTNRQGESDLLLRDGKWFLYTTVNVEEPPEGEPTDFLGADFGIVNILSDSDGTTYSGAHLNGLRHRQRRLRKRLQAKGTKSAKRLLRKFKAPIAVLPSKICRASGIGSRLGNRSGRRCTVGRSSSCVRLSSTRHGWQGCASSR